MEKMKFVKISNMIYLTDINMHVDFMSWDQSEFTERKKKNAMNKFRKIYGQDLEFVFDL